MCSRSREACATWRDGNARRGYTVSACTEQLEASCFSDQTLENDSRLGEHDRIARLEQLVLATELENEIAIAEQPRRDDRRRRIDRQLEGRCGRQGEPGAVQAYLSLEDPFLELLPEQWTGLAAALAPVIRKPASQILFRWAQSRAERSHSVARQMLLKSDQRLGTLLAFSGGVE